MQAAAEFLADLTRRGLVILLDRPSRQSVLIAGSTEYFTPVHFSIELTDHCNLRCGHCYRRNAPEGDQFLPTDKLLRLLEVLCREGVHSVELTGGEPLTHPDFLAIALAAVEIFERVAVVTNGTLLCEPILAALAVQADKLLLQVDLDGDSPEVHDALRGVPGAFTGACRAAQLIAAHGLRFRVAMNVYSGNVHRIRPTAELARRLGATRVSFSPILHIGRAADLPPLSAQQHAELARGFPSWSPRIPVSSKSPRRFPRIPVFIAETIAAQARDAWRWGPRAGCGRA